MIVCIRIRGGENDAECSDYSLTKDTITHPEHENNPFHFYRIFSHDDSQLCLYDDLGKQLVNSFCEGFNTTVFVYGQTGTGKTHTIFGSDSVVNYIMKGEYNKISKNSIDEFGFMLRCCYQIPQNFNSDKKIRSWSIKTNYIEIYNENIMDLLDPEYSKLKLRQGKEGFFFENVKYVECHTLNGFFDAIKLGQSQRQVSATACNARSSRSHTVFMMNAEIEYKDGTEIKNKLNLVDLAGSERADKAGTSDSKEHMKETQGINLSLTTLGKVINEIGQNAKVVSFRDSVLTKILKSSLMGNSKTYLVCTMSRKEINSSETWSTLQFAQRATNIQLKATKNIKLNYAQLEKLILKLQVEINAYKHELGKDADEILNNDTSDKKSNVDVFIQLKAMEETYMSLIDNYNNEMNKIKELIEVNNENIDLDQVLNEKKQQYDSTLNQIEVIKEENERFKTQNQDLMIEMKKIKNMNENKKSELDNELVYLNSEIDLLKTSIENNKLTKEHHIKELEHTKNEVEYQENQLMLTKNNIFNNDKEIIEINEEIKSFNNKIQKIAAEIKDLNDKQAAFDIVEENDRYIKLDVEYKNVVNTIKERTQEYDQKLKIFNELSDQNTQIIKDYHKILMDNKSKVSELQSKIYTKKSEFESKINEAISKEKELREIYDTKQSINKELNGIESENYTILEEIKKLETKSTEIENHYNDFEIKLNKQYESKITELNEKLENQKQIISQYQSDVIESKIASIRSEQKSILGNISNNKKSEEELKIQIDTLTVKKDSLEEEHNSVLETFDKLSEQLNKLNMRKLDDEPILIDLTSRVENKKEEMRKLEKKRVKEQEAMNVELSGLESIKNSNKEIKSNIYNVENEISEYQTKLSNLKKEFDENESAIKHFEFLREQREKHLKDQKEKENVIEEENESMMSTMKDSFSNTLFTSQNEDEDPEEHIEDEEKFTFGLKEIVTVKAEEVHTVVERVIHDEIDLTNCLKVNKYFLEKLESIGDLRHSIVYKTRCTKEFKLYTLYIIDRSMIMKHYSKSLVKNWIECCMMVSNDPQIRTSKYIKHVEKKEEAYLIENFNYVFNLDFYIQKYDLSIDSIKKIVYSLAQTLQKIHQLGIIHRNLNVNNIFVSPVGGLYITDFSRSIKVSELGNEDRIVKKYKDGDDFYFSPELFDKELSYGFYSDVYRLGGLLYKLYKQTTLTESKFDYKTDFIKSVDNEIETLLSKCLKYNPQDRISIDTILNDPMFNDIKNKSLDLELTEDVLEGQKVILETLVTFETKSLVGATKSFNIQTNARRKLKLTDSSRLFLFDLEDHCVKEFLLTGNCDSELEDLGRFKLVLKDLGQLWLFHTVEENCAWAWVKKLDQIAKDQLDARRRENQLGVEFMLKDKSEKEETISRAEGRSVRGLTEMFENM